jgi:hypothetical protein
VIARATLIAGSYDELANWEEPVFLYSATAVAHDGIGTLLDYQDDLSHGASLPLIAMASAWVRAFGPRLDALKGVAVAWSALTLLAAVMVGRRFVSPAFGLLVGVLYAGVSSDAARLQATLVGSHPESVLFCVLAIGAYWRILEHDRPVTTAPAAAGAPGAAVDAVLLGVACGLAVWCSYLAAAFAAPLLGFALARRPRRFHWALLGLVAGLLPWLVQNLWLRPHGAMQWIERVAYFRAIGNGSDLAGTVDRLAKSFGFGEPLGAVVLAALFVPAVTAVVGSLSRVEPPQNYGAPDAVCWRGTLPLAIAVLLSFASLVVARPAAVPRDGFYYYRFFMPLQLGLTWLAALGVAGLPPRLRPRAYTAAFTVAFALWIFGQAPLYGRGNTYVADTARDLRAGCAVFGHAELDRAGSAERAVGRLARIRPPACSRAAFTGYGWGLVSRYARDGDAEGLAEGVAAIADRDLHAITCDSARGLMATMYEDAMSADRRRTGALRLDAECD